MNWRLIYISTRCKLDLKDGYLVIRGEKEEKVFLQEILVLVLENTAISLTAALVAALIEHKIKVVFCDAKRLPAAELVPYAGCHDSTEKIRSQIAWTEKQKLAIWTEIVREKIRNQSRFLRTLNPVKADMLDEYANELSFGDSTNREGHAAKVYFNAIFGLGFSRTNDENPINSALNYGYSIIHSLISREIVANGYLLQLGLFHNNMFNHFNLASDIMEPIRALIDRKVYCMEFDAFSTKEKHLLAGVFECDVFVDEKKFTLANGIRLYVKSVFDAINESNPSLLQFPMYEL